MFYKNLLLILFYNIHVLECFIIYRGFQRCLWHVAMQQKNGNMLAVRWRFSAFGGLNNKKSNIINLSSRNNDDLNASNSTNNINFSKLYNLNDNENKLSESNQILSLLTNIRKNDSDIKNNDIIAVEEIKEKNIYETYSNDLFDTLELLIKDTDIEEDKEAIISLGIGLYRNIFDKNDMIKFKNKYNINPESFQTGDITFKFLSPILKGRLLKWLESFNEKELNESEIIEIKEFLKVCRNYTNYVYYCMYKNELLYSIVGNVSENKFNIKGIFRNYWITKKNDLTFVKIKDKFRAYLAIFSNEDINDINIDGLKNTCFKKYILSIIYDISEF